MITDRRQQIEAQSKGFAPIAFAPIAVTPAQDAEDFEACQSVFHDHALARQLAVVFLLFGRERMMLAFLVRRLTVLVPAVQAPVAGISQTAALFTQPQTAAFEQREVVGVTGTKSRGHNAPTLLLDHNLSFQGVPFLLAAEKVLAFFWALLPCGCLMTHSVASITTTCQTISLGRKAFLPGKVNRPERIKAFSTRRTVREAGASLKPYALAIWNSVRYSRQYISVSSNWSHKGSLGGRPKARIWPCKAWSIASKVSRRTPVSRTNSSGLRFLICS